MRDLLLDAFAARQRENVRPIEDCARFQPDEAEARRLQARADAYRAVADRCEVLDTPAAVVATLRRDAAASAAVAREWWADCPGSHDDATLVVGCATAEHAEEYARHLLYLCDTLLRETAAPRPTTPSAGDGAATDALLCPIAP